MKHKYTEAVNRKLSWERHNLISPRNVGLKGFMCSAWRGQDPRPGGSWVDVDQLDKARNGQQSNSRGIEDVEQNAFDKLLDSKDALYDQLRARSRIWLASANSAISPILSSSTVKKDSPRRTTYGPEDFQRRFQRFQSQQTPETDPEYEIDPITNRKVSKNKASENARKPIEVPVKTFKGYRSQFQDVVPPTSQPTESEVKTFIAPLNSSSKSAADPGKQSSPTRESLKDYESNRQWKPSFLSFFRYEPDGQKPESKNESPTEYDRRSSYEPSRSHQSDGGAPQKTQEPCPVQKGLQNYDNTITYGPVMYREPDGKLPEKPDSARESLKAYEKKNPIGPVRYREPDGKLPEKPCPVQEGLKAYDSKVTYGPVLWNEPDGNPPPKPDPVAEGLRDYDERADYGCRRILKNIYLGKLGSGSRDTDESFRYRNEDTREDLDLLRPSDVRAASGIIKGAKKETEEEKLAMRRKLDGDFQKQQDLHSSTCEDLSAAKEIKLQFDPTTREQLLELKIENSELQNVQAHLRGRVNAELANVSAELSSKTPERKMTGNFVRDFPEEFEAKWTAAQDSESLKPENETTSEYVESAPKDSFARDSNTPRIETSLDRTATEIGVKKKIDEISRLQNEIDPYSKVPQGLELSYAIEKAEQAKLQNEHDPYSKTPMGLETSYADEMAVKRALELERDPFSNIPQGLEISYATEKAKERELELERDPYSKVPQGLETCFIEEVKLQNEKDPYSKKPMGLETSYSDEVAAKQAEGDLSVRVSSFGKRNNVEEDKRARQLAKQEKKNLMMQKDKELVREIRSIYEEKYGILDSKHRQIPGAAAVGEPKMSSESVPEIKPVPAPQEPTVYKILAYDPTMQEINTAETTSIVPDSTSTLTPAEVLLRLSNPAKFFPHFQPLQSEGYEIVSGSGDVLVFRKIRTAGPQGSKSKSASSIQNRNTTNPIDGMQSSPLAATGNFASPTGFVNHDLPVSEPPFKSNIDVRREEPVFSGKSNWQEDSSSTRRKSKGRGKRLLIGAAWVAGCSYAIGVVAEFFRTGGIDGRGPQGF
jgi:hypothetical protein